MIPRDPESLLTDVVGHAWLVGLPTQQFHPEPPVEPEPEHEHEAEAEDEAEDGTDE